MPFVAVSERLKSSVDAVWDLVRDVERYPSLMESVRRVERLSAGPEVDGASTSTVGWEVEIEGSVLRWVERETTDERRMRITFEQESGDLDRFRGHWQVTPVDAETTEVTLEIDFEIGIPMLREVLDPFATDAIRRNSVDMLLSLGPRADDAG